MSNAAIDWAVALRFRGVAKPVLFVLANRADQNGIAFPSIKTICDECGFAERAVRGALRDLERQDLIRCEHKRGEPTRYLLRVTPAPHAGPTPASNAPRQEMPPAYAATNPGISCQEPRQEMPPTPASGATITQKNPKEPKLTVRARASRLPPDWEPSSDLQAFARTLGLDPFAVADQFRDYWIAKAGADGCKLDWPATYRNWCRREAERKPRASQKPIRNGFIASLVAEREDRLKPPVVDMLALFPKAIGHGD